MIRLLAKLRTTLLDPSNALAAVVLLYLAMAALTFLPAYPGGVDTSTHLFQFWLIGEQGFTSWNSWWYGGVPLLDEYPPLTHAVGAALSLLIGEIDAYKLLFTLGFVLTPLSFWYFLKEFRLTPETRALALYFFSFSIVYVHYFQSGVFSQMASVPFAIAFMLFMKRAFEGGKAVNMLLASAFLSLAALSQMFNPVGAVIFMGLFFLVFCRNVQNLLRFAYVLIITFVLTSFFYIPFVANYQMNSDTGGALSLAKIASAPFELFGRAFVGYISIASAVAFAGVMALLLVVFVSRLRKKEYEYPVFLALMFALPAVMLVVMPISAIPLIKAPPFVPVFLAIALARASEASGIGKTLA